MIDVEIEAEAWREALADAEVLTVRAAEAALDAADRKGEVVVLLTDDEAVRDLNTRFRGKDQPTNVLSFPAPDNPQGTLGDIALAYETCAREAAEQGKTLAAHLQHLVAHGVLHLVGYEHDVDADAEIMEALERRVLAALGVADPYA
jgi:probable rRNA maturation factor